MVRPGLTSQHQDLPILSLFAVLAVLAILILFAILSYSIYRSRFGAKSTTSSSAAVDGHSSRWAALPADHYRRCTSATLLATPEPGRDFEQHHNIIDGSTLDQQRSFWAPSINVDLCDLRSYSQTLAPTYSPTHRTTYSPIHREMCSATHETTYSPTPESTYSLTPGTTYSPASETTSSPALGET